MPFEAEKGHATEYDRLLASTFGGGAPPLIRCSQHFAKVNGTTPTTAITLEHAFLGLGR